MKILQSLFLTIALSCSLHATTIQDLQPELIGIVISYLDGQSHELAVDSHDDTTTIGEVQRLLNCSIHTKNEWTKVARALLFKHNAQLAQITQKIAGPNTPPGFLFDNTVPDAVFATLAHQLQLQKSLIELTIIFPKQTILTENQYAALAACILHNQQTLRTLVVANTPNERQLPDQIKRQTASNNTQLSFPCLEKIGLDYSSRITTTSNPFILFIAIMAPQCKQIQCFPGIYNQATNLMIDFCQQHPDITPKIKTILDKNNTPCSLCITPETINLMLAHQNFNNFCKHYKYIRLQKLDDNITLEQNFFTDCTHLIFDGRLAVNASLTYFSIDKIQHIACYETIMNLTTTLPNCTSIELMRCEIPSNIEILQIVPNLKKMCISACYFQAMNGRATYNTIYNITLPSCTHLTAGSSSFTNNAFQHMLPNLTIADIWVQETHSDLIQLLVDLINRYPHLQSIILQPHNNPIDLNANAIARVLRTIIRLNNPLQRVFITIFDTELNRSKTYIVVPHIPRDQQEEFEAKFPNWKYITDSDSNSSSWCPIQ